ncbi:hypothetical protein KKI17_03465 [Patescibacteria group bacterium]|nr:hypothetical protein [Patescibacteria group bacterium]
MKRGVYDIGVGWGHPADQVFAGFFREAVKKKGIEVREVTYGNLEEDFKEILAGRLSFRVFVDRSSEDHPAFALIAERLKRGGSHVVNDPVLAAKFGSKALLHELFAKEGIPVLPTVFLYPGKKTSFASFIKKERPPFVLKPSHGGGGDYVVLTARTAKDIERALQDNAPDATLLQSYLAPSSLLGRAAWFRAIFVAGTVISLWWDPHSSFYEVFASTAEEKRISQELEKIALRIAGLTGLELFSTEAALNGEGEIKVVDYVNQPIDLNVQERAPNGLPTPVVRTIASQLALRAAAFL